MPTLSRQQLLLLVSITVVWGFNWPMLKIGVNTYPALSFRIISMWIAIPLLALVIWRMRMPFVIPRHHWSELLQLMVSNYLIWYTLVILALPFLNSGRTAILGYTMPIFSAVLGYVIYRDPLKPRAILGVVCASVAVLLLLWHELTSLAGSPWALATVLASAATWGYGTQRMRRTVLTVPTVTAAFWMLTLSTPLMTVLAWFLESDQWHWPSAVTWVPILYNTFGVFVFAQTAWLVLARGLPPIASTLSVMFIPILGVFNSSLILGEVLHTQDYGAVALIVVAIALVLWPSRGR
jgi:drug/metabolite transporter (DMT)-like permease